MTTADNPRELPVVLASNLDAAPEGGRRWLLEGLWARAAVGIVGGAPKCCKSWLGLDMALSVASGTPCLGRFPATEPGPVLVYLAEDSQAVLKERLDGLCLHRSLDISKLPLHVITAPSLRLDVERDQLRLAETVLRLRPRLLLLDPFVRLHRVDENNAGEVSTLLAYLRELQRAHDLSVAVVHHARKNGPSGSQAGQALRGSGDFHAWGDSNLYLRRMRDQLLLSVEHRATPSPLTITLRLALAPAPQLELSDGLAQPSPPRPARSDGLDDAILRALSAAAGPVARAFLRANLRVRNESLGDSLLRLAADGRVVAHGDRWSLPIHVVPETVPDQRPSGTRNGT